MGSPRLGLDNVAVVKTSLAGRQGAMHQRAIEDLATLRDRGEQGYPEFDGLHGHLAEHPLELD